MIAAEDRAERARRGLGLRDAVLVEVVPEHVDAVGPAQVVEAVAVEIGQGDAGRRGDEGSDGKILLNPPAELKRRPVGAGELKVGDVLGDLSGLADRLGEAGSVELGEAGEGRGPARGDLFGRVVARKKRCSSYS
jgi:hypothetical protein